MNRVLIVDDDLQLLTILTESLERYRDKFAIITAKDGLVAIKALQKIPFSVVVTDIKMPKVNGLVLLAYVAENFPQIPCILMTAYGTPFLRKRLGQDASHYIEKPFEVAELVRAIMSALGQQDNLGGTLNGVSVAGFLKLVEMEYMTCLCEIGAPDTEKAYLLFEGGVLWNAFFGNLRGEKAALKLLRMKDVTIKFRKPPKKKVPRRIQTELSALLMEAMKSDD